MAFWATCKIAQPIQPIWQHIFALPWSALKKPLWEFNFFHIFGIPSSSRHEKCYQMLERLFAILTTLETYRDISGNKSGVCVYVLLLIKPLKPFIALIVKYCQIMQWWLVKFANSKLPFNVWPGPAIAMKSNTNVIPIGSLFTVQQRYTYRVLQIVQMKLILLCVWAERAILGSAKTA